MRARFLGGDFSQDREPALGKGYQVCRLIRHAVFANQTPVCFAFCRESNGAYGSACGITSIYCLRHLLKVAESVTIDFTIQKRITGLEGKPRLKTEGSCWKNQCFSFYVEEVGSREAHTQQISLGGN